MHCDRTFARSRGFRQGWHGQRYDALGSRSGVRKKDEEEEGGKGSNVSEEAATAAAEAALSRDSARRCAPQSSASMSASSLSGLEFARGLGGGRRTKGSCMEEGESCRRIARDEDGESERRSDACNFWI